MTATAIAVKPAKARDGYKTARAVRTTI